MKGIKIAKKGERTNNKLKQQTKKTNIKLKNLASIYNEIIVWKLDLVFYFNID